MRVGQVTCLELAPDGNRLTGTYHLTEDRQAIRQLDRFASRSEALETLCDASGIFRGAQFRRIPAAHDKAGRPYVSARDIEFSIVRPAGYISFLHGELLEDLTIREGMILITCSGMNLGKAIWARRELSGLCASHDLIRIVPSPDRIPPGYLYAFLASRYGRVLIRKQIYGGHIKHVEPFHIKKLTVPRLHRRSELAIHQRVEKSGILMSDSRDALEIASDQIFAATRVPNPTGSEWDMDRSDLSFTVWSSDLHSLRAWNLSRRAQRIQDAIRAGRWSPLGEVVDQEWLKWRVMFQRREASHEFGVEVLAQRPLFRLLPDGRWLSREYLLHLSPRFIVPDETILVAKQGTLGENELFCRAEFITGATALARAYSDHCMRLVAIRSQIDPGYLFAFLRSEAGFRLLRSFAEGSKQQDLHWRTIPSLPIPRLSKAKELEIGNVVRSAYAKRNEAIDLLLRAFRDVETAISEGD
jgi:hypothetical protein